jgi:hypothetical protein
VSLNQTSPKVVVHVRVAETGAGDTGFDLFLLEVFEGVSMLVGVAAAVFTLFDMM